MDHFIVAKFLKLFIRRVTPLYSEVLTSSKSTVMSNTAIYIWKVFFFSVENKEIKKCQKEVDYVPNFRGLREKIVEDRAKPSAPYGCP